MNAQLFLLLFIVNIMKHTKIKWQKCDIKWKDFKMRQAGILIETKSNIFLLGDINCSGGECDDCPGIFNNDKIIAYAQIIDMDNLC